MLHQNRVISTLNYSENLINCQNICICGCTHHSQLQNVLDSLSTYNEWLTHWYQLHNGFSLFLMVLSLICAHDVFERVICIFCGFVMHTFITVLFLLFLIDRETTVDY